MDITIVAPHMARRKGPSNIYARNALVSKTKIVTGNGNNKNFYGIQVFAKWAVGLHTNRKYMGFLAVSASEMPISQIPRYCQSIERVIECEKWGVSMLCWVVGNTRLGVNGSGNAGRFAACSSNAFP